jgi:hypothetical protein
MQGNFGKHCEEKVKRTVKAFSQLKEAQAESKRSTKEGRTS